MSVTSNVQIGLKVLRSQKIGDHSMSLYFDRPAGFNFEAGDWIDLQNYGSELKGGKTYSLSSAPTESEIAISFRLGISPFKQSLQSAQPGDKFYISQYGNDYEFHLREHRNSVLIAGGIGIAPFRSMLKEQYDTNSKNLVQLLYFDKDVAYLFQEEIEQWRCKLPLDVHYIKTDTLKRKDRLKIFNNVMQRDAHHYFIAGPEGMVESTEHVLIDMGIPVRDIRVDSFGGY